MPHTRHTAHARSTLTDNLSALQYMTSGHRFDGGAECSRRAWPLPLAEHVSESEMYSGSLTASSSPPDVTAICARAAGRLSHERPHDGVMHALW